MSAGAGGCDGHTGLPAEFRAAILTALDRVAPVIEGIRVEQGAGPPAAAEHGGAEGSTASAPTACASCPVCAVIAAWRGERSDLAARFAEHASGLVAVLRAALDEGAGAPSSSPYGPEPGGTSVPPRPVQRISVHR